ncbi:MAG: aminopeptidase [Candidatus Muiribacteriota bacterium]|jgi:aminopeptidase
MDERVKKLADILVNYSCNIKAGEKILIAGDTEAKPLMIECYREALKRKAHPLIRVDFLETKKILFDEGDDNQIEYKDNIRKYTFENIDALINIYAPSNLKMLTSVNPDKQVKFSKANKECVDIIMKKKWVGVNYPTNALAQEAGMSLEEYENFVYGATNIDWEKTKSSMAEIKKIFDSGSKIRILGKDTDLTFSIEGREGTMCCGENNMPDGELFYAPVENSANGEIYYEFPAITNGREVEGVRLKFKDGKVVEAKAKKNEEFLIAMLDTDEGSRFIGEFGIGLNYGIDRFTKDILFDEKIGGTIHLAVGQAYEESGGTNESAVHWDMVKDLRSHGQIFIDDKLVQQNGKFLV